MGISYTPRQGHGCTLKDGNLIGFRILLIAHVHVFCELHICVRFPRMVSILAQRNILVLVASCSIVS